MMNPTSTLKLRDLLGGQPVIPVLTIPDATEAVPLGRALAAGGLNVLEVTLRTAGALEAIRRLRDEAGIVVGAGTIVSAADLEAAKDAGAAFAVSPGLTNELAAAAPDIGLPLLPGVMTPSEAMAAHDQGFSFLKLFPARVAGGVAFLKAIGGPLPDLAFCPTGGIGPDDFRDYLALANVVTVGGSWVAPKDAVTAHDWDRITRLAHEASSLGKTTS
jgi:2-dehydro-3-deoxyphosphogluconate aldolase/(4S)-4-hydroxy-2-oxoglutarate aldolase